LNHRLSLQEVNRFGLKLVQKTDRNTQIEFHQMETPSIL
jgi:hypothetical protein